MLGLFKDRKFLFGGLALLLAVLATVYFLYFRSSQPNPSAVVSSDAVMSDLAKGDCSDETKAQLKAASNSGNASERAKLYESQGLCFVYAGNLSGALEAYKLSKDAYTEAGLPNDATRLNGAIEGVTAATAPMPTQASPADDEDVIGGN